MPKFEWDPAKAAGNLRKHGVSFETAQKAFSDWNAIERLDDDPDEPRFIRIGMADGDVVAVVYTERRNVIRIISARKARRREQKIYFDQTP
jgi:uncharacterized DUF497 family protein